MKKIYSLNTITILCSLAGLLILLPGCKKLVEVDSPVTSTSGQNAYQFDATAAAVLTGIYTNLSSAGVTSGSSPASFMSLFPGLSSDEFTLYNGAFTSGFIAYYKNALTSLSGPNIWQNTYSYIYICNAAIQGISQSTSLTPSVKQQLLGEAKFMRAFFYFYMVNLYGDVPLALSTDYKVNSLLARSSKDLVYQQIISDCKEAQTLMGTQYLSADILSAASDRARPTKWAATALLARIYLFRNTWNDAEAQTDSIISNTSLFGLSDLDHAFLKAQNGNTEAIWQLQPVNTGWNTQEAVVFKLNTNGPNEGQPVYLSQTLLDSFETGDLRKKNWVDSVVVNGSPYYFPNKYKSATYNDPVTEYQMVFRLAEQILIRAEARARQNKFNGPDGAIADLNTIRQRAGLNGYTGPWTQDSVLAAIWHERQVELFTEWGHRWFDLKRTGNIDKVMAKITPLKGGTWNTNWQYYPLPMDEMNADPKLTQNTGY